MGIMAAFAGANLLFSGVSAFMQMRQASAQADAVEEAERQTAELRQRELDRQQREVTEAARSEKTDTVRRYEQELGTVRAAAGDFGATDTSLVALISEVGAAEGTDLDRIEDNRQARIDALQGDKEVVTQGYTNRVTRAYNKAASARTSAILGFVGSALRIGGGVAAQSVRAEAARNVE